MRHTSTFLRPSIKTMDDHQFSTLIRGGISRRGEVGQMSREREEVHSRLFIAYTLIDVFLVKASLNNSANINGSPSLSRTELGSIAVAATWTDHVIF